MPTITLNTLARLKERGEKITALTAYDATFARVLSTAGIEVLLVGDSLGMVVSGHTTTVPVTLDDITYHTRCVSRGNQGALLMTDLPFMTYSQPAAALANAAQLMQAGAAIVKMEGGEWLAETIHQMTVRGIPVCGHLGLTPQSVNSLGGYYVQGKTAAQKKQLLTDAQTLAQAGARLLILECVPYELAGEISQQLTIPVIGIGAGALCDGQILVTYDMLGLTPGKSLTFVKNFMTEQPSSNSVSIFGAVEAYREAVKQGSFPGKAHSFFF